MFSRKKQGHVADNVFDIAPDEVMLDSSNLPDFDTSQFEGRIEKPITKATLAVLGLVFTLLVFAYLGRVGYLQVVHGETYRELGENNRLSHSVVFSRRGIIKDRNDVELAWNVPGSSTDFASRTYLDEPGFGHLLGYVSYPQTDASGIYYQTAYEGKAGVESEYNDLLNGQNGLKIIETDALMAITSQNVIDPPQDGDDLKLTIDARVQKRLYEVIVDLSNDRGFEGGSGVLMNVETGEILAITNYPEYSPMVLSEGSDDDLIASYILDESKPFLNRAISGRYTPGSTVKPFMALAALEQGIIKPDKSILSTGSISLENPYNPELRSVFTDWKAHGWVDMRRAIAVSSNIYFYYIGGGFADQEGLGIAAIERFMRMFRLGAITGIDLPSEVTGVIPNPAWKESLFDGESWRIGDTYNTSIGQYGFQVTPIQMVRAISMLASGGKLVQPHVVTSTSTRVIQLDVDADNVAIVREGMRMSVTEGIAQGLNLQGIAVAAKTGTAEVGVTKALVNSWIVGFFPYDDPQYAFTIVMEKGPRDNLVGSVFAMRQLLLWMQEETPEYLSLD